MPEKAPERKLLSITEAAGFCSVHPNTIRNLIQSGKLPAVRIGARIIRVSLSDLEAVLTPYAGGEFGVWSR